MRSFAEAMVTGLQGEPGSADFLRPPHVIATAKHFLGDGGISRRSRSRATILRSEAQLRDIHAAGYPAAIAAGVQSVMVSYSSWQGVKMHGNASLLTGVLKGRHGVRWHRRERLERAWPGARLHHLQLSSGADCRSRHVHGTGQLEAALREHVGAGTFWRGSDRATRRCRTPHSARQVPIRDCSKPASLRRARSRGSSRCSVRQSIVRWRVVRCASRWCY